MMSFEILSDPSESLYSNYLNHFRTLLLQHLPVQSLPMAL